MKLIKLAILLLCLLFLLTACDSFPPLAPGNSRIIIEGYGFGSVYIEAVSGSYTTGKKELSFFVVGEEYLDVPVPPTDYTVLVDNRTFQTVSFSGPGETKKFSYVGIPGVSGNVSF
jgi:hypothetical protein